MKDLDTQSKTVFLKDYRAPDFAIDHVDLTFELDEDKTRVLSVLRMTRQDDSNTSPLVLSGENLILGELKLDNELLDADAYSITDTELTIHTVPDSFSLFGFGSTTRARRIVSSERMRWYL